MSKSNTVFLPGEKTQPGVSLLEKKLLCVAAAATLVVGDSAFRSHNNLELGIGGVIAVAAIGRAMWVQDERKRRNSVLRLVPLFDPNAAPGTQIVTSSHPLSDNPIIVRTPRGPSDIPVITHLAQPDAQQHQ